jgi:GTP-binding protein
LLEEAARLKAKLQARGCEVFEISAATGEGVQPMLWRVMTLIKEARAQLPHVEVPPNVNVTRVERERPLSVREIARYADGMSEWEVEGGPLERLMQRFDMENTEAVLYVHRILERSGALEDLRKAGVKEGDLVHAGSVAFAFEE